jgi:hypothetical protein
MKRLTLILTILIAAASCTLSAADAPKRHGWDNDSDGPLYGNVESVTITRYSLKDSLGVLSRSEIKYKSFYKFSESGDVTEASLYASVGSLFSKYIYKYDTKGNKTEETMYDSAGSLDNKWIYKYDSKGNETEKTEYYGEMQKPGRQAVSTIIYRK